MYADKLSSVKTVLTYISTSNVRIGTYVHRQSNNVLNFYHCDSFFLMETSAILPFHTHWNKTDAGQDWGQEEKRVTDEMVRGHHQLNGHEFEQILGDSEGQGSLLCCSPWGYKESDMTKKLNNKKCNFNLHFSYKLGIFNFLLRYSWCTILYMQLSTWI